MMLALTFQSSCKGENLPSIRDTVNLDASDVDGSSSMLCDLPRVNVMLTGA